MTVEHIVWDWNGTIFGDGVAMIESTIDAFRLCGLPPVALADYQRHHTQPIPAFYERLAGRPLTAGEQRRLAECFRTAYARHRPELTLDARPALAEWAAAGGRQSLLSMYPHQALMPLVTAAGIAPLFTRIDGTIHPAPDYKASHLAGHLRRQQLDPGVVLLVGDSVDDVRAARECGVRCVVYHPGRTALHARDHFAGLDVPIVATLRAAVEHARSQP
jgi:phosphoglycolate phosphatase-like HAD superfamily hydrolase